MAAAITRAGPLVARRRGLLTCSILADVMNLPLLSLLALTACQDYHFSPEVPDQDDSGGQVPDEPIGPPAGVVPITPLVEDTGTRACDLEPRVAAPYLGAPTCTPLAGVTWDVVVEGEIFSPTARPVLGPPVVAPGSDGGTLIYAQIETADGSDSALAGFEPATGMAVSWVEGTRIATGGLVVFRGSSPADRGLKAAVSWGWTQDEIDLLDLKTGAVSIGAEPDEGASVIARDLWHDGSPEVVSGSFAYTMDGTIAVRYPTRTLDKWTVLPWISDIEGEGHDQLMNAKGWWDATTGAGVEWDGFSLQSYPENPEGYILFMGGAVSWHGTVVAAGNTGESHFIADATGQVLWLDALDDGDDCRETATVPALGDLDGDGEPELAADLHGDTTLVYELDGSVRWSQPTGAHLFMGRGVSRADLDADGVYEMLVWGDTGLWVLDGTDGTVLSHWQEGYTPGWLIAPVIADVDADGSAEIVLAGRREDDPSWWSCRIFILGPANGRWARTRPVWNQLPYDVTGVRDDGTVPVFPRSNPQTYNAWRAQPAHDGDHPDLEVEVVETCRDDERGVVALQAVVHNRGSQDAPTGAVVRLLTWNEDTDGPLQEVAAQTLDEPIPSMTTSAGVIFRVSTETWATRQVVQVDGAHDDECDLVNDRVDVWEE